MKVVNKVVPEITVEEAIQHDYFIGFIHDNKAYSFSKSRSRVESGCLQTYTTYVSAEDIVNHINAGADVHAFRTTKELHTYFANNLK
jgi:hypothetical protein